jgi:hypothetical protein
VGGCSGTDAGTDAGADAGAGRGTVHFHAEELMDEHSLTLGANLLLWVFPLVLTILVVAERLLDARARGR